MYPKLKFEIAPKELELTIFKRHLLSQQRSKGLLKLYPELNRNIDEFIINTQKNKEKLMLENIPKYLKYWDTKSESFFKLLESVINSKFSQKEFTAYLSLDPTCPRYLNKNAFNVFYHTSADELLLTITHELTHFLYFKKFKELFSDVPERHYDYPHVEWILSEILVSIILKDLRFDGFFKIKPGSYPVFYQSKIGSKTIMKFFEDKYKQMVEKDKKKFDDYLKWAYDYAKKHEKQLMVVK
jgi:hypothetical protein